MLEVGTSISGNKHEALTTQMVEEADVVVTMRCGGEEVCPATLEETEEWELANPRDKPLCEVRRIRDEVKAKVALFLHRIEYRSKSQRQGQMSPRSWRHRM